LRVERPIRKELAADRKLDIVKIVIALSSIVRGKTGGDVLNRPICEHTTITERVHVMKEAKKHRKGHS